MSNLSILLPFALPESGLPLSAAVQATLEQGRWSSPTPATGVEELLFQLFGVPFRPGRLPAAPLAYWGTSGEYTPHWCLRVDPVHLHARRHELVMVREPDLGLEPGEAAELTALLEHEYAGLGWRVVAPEPQSWFLFPTATPDIDTTPPGRIGEGNIDPYLPAGPEALEWRQRLNEIQMLFHDVAVNTRREDAGKLPVNSVWFWGGGRMPAAVPRSWDQVFTDDALATGLAKLTGTPLSAEPPQTGEMMELLKTQDRKLLILLSHESDDPWRQALADLIDQGADRVRLIRPDGATLVPRTTRRRWWQRFAARNGEW